MLANANLRAPVASARNQGRVCSTPRPSGAHRCRPLQAATSFARHLVQSQARGDAQRVASIFGTQRQSVDPMEAKKANFEFGHVFRAHSDEEVMEIVTKHSPKTVVLMCKSSHCKPCKAFMRTYYQYATRFADTAFLDIVGDESPTTRKCMIDWGVKVTPTFRIYKDGVFAEAVTGTTNDMLLNAIISHIKPEHRGRDWTPPEDSSDDDE